MQTDDTVVMEVDWAQVEAGIESSSLAIIHFDFWGGLENRLAMFCCPAAGFNVVFCGIYFIYNDNNNNESQFIFYLSYFRQLH